MIITFSFILKVFLFLALKGVEIAVIIFVPMGFGMLLHKIWPEASEGIFGKAKGWCWFGGLAVLCVLVFVVGGTALLCYSNWQLVNRILG